MTEKFKENKDITEQYNEFKQREKMIRDEIRNKKQVREGMLNFIKYFFIVIAILVVTIIVCRPILKILEDYKGHFIFDINEKMSESFSGKFEILSPDTAIDNSNNNVIYEIKDKNGIIFKAKNSNSFLITDYDQYLYKKYVTEYIKNKKVSNVILKDDEFELDSGRKFFKFKFGIKIDSYEQIDKIINNDVNELFEYINKRAKRDFKDYPLDFTIEIYLNDFTVEVKSYEKNDCGNEYCINKVKVNYIRYLANNNLQDDNVIEQDYEKYNKAEQMKVVINGNSPLYPYAQLDYGKMDYWVELYIVADYMNCFENYKKNIATYITQFKYKGKNYYLNDDLSMEVKGNKFSNQWTMKMLEDFFDAEISYDYDNKTINIIIPNVNME